MPVIGLILAVVGGIAFWWWRIQMLKGAADSALDVRRQGARHDQPRTLPP